MSENSKILWIYFFHFSLHILHSYTTQLHNNTRTTSRFHENGTHRNKSCDFEELGGPWRGPFEGVIGPNWWGLMGPLGRVLGPFIGPLGAKFGGWFPSLHRRTLARPWSCSLFSISSVCSGTRSWSAVPSDKGRARFRSSVAWSGTGWSEIPSPAPTFGTSCTSDDRASFLWKPEKSFKLAKLNERAKEVTKCKSSYPFQTENFRAIFMRKVFYGWLLHAMPKIGCCYSGCHSACAQPLWFGYFMLKLKISRKKTSLAFYTLFNASIEWFLNRNSGRYIWKYSVRPGATEVDESLHT